MKNLLFVSRVAFISNVCMLLAIIIRYVEMISSKDLQSTIIIMGFLLSFLFNFFALIGVVIIFMKRQSSVLNPRWLFIINFLCFIFQLYFLLI